MSSAQSVPSIGVGASRLGGCEQVRTAGALELLAALHRTFGPRRAELPEPLVVRDAELAGRRFPAPWPGRRTWGRATGGRPRWPRADFEDSNAPMFDKPPSGTAIRPAPSLSWSSNCTARKS